MSRYLVWLIGLAAALWPAAFMIVAEDFQDLGAAIRHKLTLEIAGIEPDAGVGTAPRFARPPHAGQLNSGPIPVTRSSRLIARLENACLSSTGSCVSSQAVLSPRHAQ